MGEALRINSGERKGPRGQGIPNGARRRPGQVELEVPGSGEGGTGRSPFLPWLRRGAPRIRAQCVPQCHVGKGFELGNSCLNPKSTTKWLLSS